MTHEDLPGRLYGREAKGMSYVTNLILHMGMIEDEDERIKEVNAFFDEDDNPLVGLNEQPLPPGWYGGTKYLECNLYVGAFNYFQLDDFLKHLQTIKWRAPEDVQLFIKDQDDYKFRIIYGVEEYEERLYPRNLLLCEAQDWLEDLAKIVTDPGELQMLKDWQERYKRLR